MQITLAEPIDLTAIAKIDKDIIGTDSRKTYLKKAIKEHKCLVVKTESLVVGYLVYSTTFFDCSFIDLVIVHPLERKKGYAKSLIAYFETISPTKKVFSSTNQSNQNMQKLFTSIGYVPSGFVDNLDEGDPEIIYFKQLPS